MELPELRAFVDTTKRAIVAAEQRYDINEAVRLLQELAGPLVRSEECFAQWKVRNYALNAKGG